MIKYEKWCKLSTKEQRATKFAPLTSAQKRALEKTSTKQYITYLREFKAQKRRNYQEGYRKGAIKQYERIYSDIDLTLTDDARKRTYATTLSPEEFAKLTKTRTLGKNLHRLKMISSGNYKIYWSSQYIENYKHALIGIYGGEGGKLASAIRYAQDNLDDSDVDKILSELPPLKTLYDETQQEESANKIFDKISSVLDKWELDLDDIGEEEE